MTLAQLRKKYRPASTAEVLDGLAAIFDDPKVPEEYIPPLLTVVLASGHSFRGYLLGVQGEKEKTYLFSLEIQHEGDGAADLAYVQGGRIELVTVWNVDDYPGTLPRHPKKP